MSVLPSTGRSVSASSVSLVYSSRFNKGTCLPEPLVGSPDVTSLAKSLVKLCFLDALSSASTPPSSFFPALVRDNIANDVSVAFNGGYVAAFPFSFPEILGIFNLSLP
ncbi:hypothetical protein V6Z11_D11G225500 [Gossypium hirsutum]